MSGDWKSISLVRYGTYTYPLRHWEELRRFAVGDEADPRGLFSLAEDTWEVWRYAEAGRPTNARFYRFRFGRLNSFIKPYVKWYCYERLISSGGKLGRNTIKLPGLLSLADRFILEQDFTSIDDLAPQVIFEELWAAQITRPKAEGQTRHLHTAVVRQELTRGFWIRLRFHFGSPHIVPPVAPHHRTRPVEFAGDEDKVIPDHVVQQLVNRLALHRRKVQVLNRYHHLRLCVLILSICLGRRIDELLSSPRLRGTDGPLSREPARGCSRRGALWFRFEPNKNGPASKVFVSPEWEEVATYCVRKLARYSDEIRQYAPPEERALLILVSRSNLTKGLKAALAQSGEVPALSQGGATASAGTATGGLLYDHLRSWLNGYSKNGAGGVLKTWNITEDGSPEGPIYFFRLNDVRHTRQSALAGDPQIPLHARQRDLNHNDVDGQFTYQHRLRENNDALLEKIKAGKFAGAGSEWLAELLGVEATQGGKAGRPSPLSPRLLALVKNNPLFLQQNRVPCGICILPQGPGGCPEFMNCTGAREGGCHCFMVDTENAQMLWELSAKARAERRLQRKSAVDGRIVQAAKREAQARRTEELRDAALRQASSETIKELRRLQIELDDRKLWAEE